RVPEPYKDITDWLRDGHGRTDFEALVAQSAAYQQSHASRTQEYPLSDAYNANTLVQAYGHALRYCAAWKSWLVWTGTHWRRDVTDTALRLQRRVVMDMGARLPLLEDSAAKALLGHIKSSLSTARLKAAVEQAKSWDGMSVEAEKLDT